MNKKIIKNKKSIHWSNINSLIIGIITLIILSVYINNLIEESNYKNSILICSSSFKEISGKNSFFDSGGINNNFVKLISNNCPSKTIEDSSIRDSVDLVLDCYYKTNKGNNIFANSAIGETICLYCGDLKFNKDIENFNKKFINELKKRKINFSEQETKNLNQYFLLNEYLLPKNIKKGDILIVNYYTRYLNDKTSDFENKDSIKKTETNNNDPNSIFNQLNKMTISLVNLIPADINSNIVSSIVISKLNQNNINDFNQDKELEFKEQITGETLVNCGENFIIPKKNYKN